MAQPLFFFFFFLLGNPKRAPRGGERATVFFFFFRLEHKTKKPSPSPPPGARFAGCPKRKKKKKKVAEPFRGRRRCGAIHRLRTKTEPRTVRSYFSHHMFGITTRLPPLRNRLSPRCSTTKPQKLAREE